MNPQKRGMLMLQMVVVGLVMSDSIGAKLVVNSDSAGSQIELLRSNTLKSNIDKAFENEESNFKLGNLAAISRHASVNGYGSAQNGGFRYSNLGRRIQTGVHQKESYDLPNPSTSQYQVVIPQIPSQSQYQVVIPQIPSQLQSVLGILALKKTTTESPTTSTATESSSETSAVTSSMTTESSTVANSDSSSAATDSSSVAGTDSSSTATESSTVANSDSSSAATDSSSVANTDSSSMTTESSTVANSDSSSAATDSSSVAGTDSSSTATESSTVTNSDSSSAATESSSVTSAVTSSMTTESSSVANSDSSSAATESSSVTSAVTSSMTTESSSVANSDPSSAATDSSSVTSAVTSSMTTESSSVANSDSSSAATESSSVTSAVTSSITTESSSVENSDSSSAATESSLVTSAVTSSMTTESSSVANSVTSSATTEFSSMTSAVTSSSATESSSVASAETSSSTSSESTTSSTVASSTAPFTSGGIAFIPNVPPQSITPPNALSQLFSNFISLETIQSPQQIANQIKPLAPSAVSPTNNQQSDSIPDELYAIITAQHGNISTPSQINSPFDSSQLWTNYPQNVLTESPKPGTAQDTAIQQVSDVFDSNTGTDAVLSNSTNQTPGSNPVGSITSQIQTVGSQISGGFSNSLNVITGSNNNPDQSQSGSSPLASITTQFQSVGSQIAGGFNNATGVTTGSNTNAGIQGQLQQLINAIGFNQGSKPSANQRSDTFLQQLGSQLSNNQNVGSQIAGGFNNATSVITGSNTNAEIQSQLQQLINTIGSNQGSKPLANQQSDTFLQQLGSQFSNAFGSNNANQSSGSNPLGSITTQLQNAGSQIAAGFTNVTNTVTDSSNSANQTSGSNPVGSITSQLQAVGSQITGGFSNASNVITGSNNNPDQSQSGSSPLESITTQFQTVGSQISGGFNNATSAITGSNTNAGIQGQLQQLIDTIGINQGSKPSANPQSDTFLQQLGSQLTNNQNVGSQIAGGLNNATSVFTGSNTTAEIQSQLQQLINTIGSNQGSKPSANQQSDTFLQQLGAQIVNNQNVGSQIAGGLNNATSIITGSNTTADIQSQLQQLINTIGSNQGSKPSANQQSDTFLQQLGSQFTNAFGSNSANQSSESNPLDSFTTQLQNVGSQIIGGFTNATNTITGSNNSANETSGSNPLEGIASQFQNVGSQISTGFMNVSSAIAGSNNDVNQTSGSSLLEGIASQFQNLGSQITGGISTVPVAIMGKNSNFSSSEYSTTLRELKNQLLQMIKLKQNGPPPANALQNTGVFGLFQQVGSQITNPLGSNSANQSSGSSPLSSITSQFQNVGSQITGGISNATGGLIPNAPNPFENQTPDIKNLTNQLSPSTVSQTSNQVVNALQPTSIQGQLEGIGSQLQANFPPIYKDEGVGSTNDPMRNLTLEIQNLISQLSSTAGSEPSNQNAEKDKPDGSSSQLQANVPSTSNGEGLVSNIAGLESSVLNWNLFNQLPTNLPGNTGNNINNNLFSTQSTLPLFCPVCAPVCGKTNPRTLRDLRLAGGTPLTPSNKYPWIARFTYFTANAGQGSLINDRAVLTTATVVKDMFVFSQVKVLFNVFDLTSTTEQRLEKTASNVIKHPFFNPQIKYNYDIGLVILATPVTITSTFMPICLPLIFDSYAGNNAVTVGWGASSPSGATSSVPQELSIPLYSDRECRLSNSRLTFNNLCGGVIKPAPPASIKATCKGDGGAGLMYPSLFDSSVLTLAGVAIEVPNEGCGETNQLSLFSRTLSYIDFILIFGYGCGC